MAEDEIRGEIIDTKNKKKLYVTPLFISFTHTRRDTHTHTQFFHVPMFAEYQT